MSARRPQVVAFDVNETLLDLGPVRAALVELGQPADLLPAAEKSRNCPNGMRTTPAGTEMKLRTIGTMRPKKTAERPCRSNQAKVLSTSAVSTSGSRSRNACERRGPSARPT